MPLEFAPTPNSHPAFSLNKSYAPGDIFAYDDGGVIKAFIVQTAFVSTDFATDSVNFNGIGGAGGVYTGTSTVTVGGATAGTTFVDQDLQNMMSAILEPFQEPTFNAFALTGFSILEVGDNIPSGSQTFTWSTTDPSNVEPNTVEVLDLTGGSVVLGTGLANDGTESLSLAGAITKTAIASHTFRITADDTQATLFQRDYSVSWRFKKFYGKDTNATLTEALVEGLPSSSLDTNFSGTYALPVGAGYAQFAFPSSWGTATTFKDQSTGLDVAMEILYIVGVTNSFGVLETYNIHRSTNILNGAITIIIS